MKILLKQTKPGNLPYVSMYHDRNLYNFLIDTGSTSSWLEARTLGVFLQETESKIQSKVINGERHNALVATLRLEPREYTEKDDTAFKFRAVFVTDELENLELMNNHVSEHIHGILGMDFLSENVVSIDLKSHSMTA